MQEAALSQWAQAFGPALQPAPEAVAAFVGSPLWGRLCRKLEEGYGVHPLAEYSGCAAQPGWNVKYKKGGKALCTLYPMQGFFIAMVSVAPKDEEAAALLLPGLQPYTREVFARSKSSKMGRWLMIKVRDDAVLEDVLQLVALRMAKK